MLKWTADSREVARLGYHFRTLLENLKTLRSPSASLHEYSVFTILEFSSRERFTNLSHEFRQTRRFEGVRFFPNSPTLAPWGSGLTPTIRFHENSRIPVKNVTLGSSEWTRVLRIFRNGHIEAVSWNYPLAHINRELCTVNFFHHFLAFSEVLLTFLQFLRDKGSRVSRLSQFSKVFLSLLLLYLSAFEFVNIVSRILIRKSHLRFCLCITFN
jgi:hypothetical protein